MNRGLVKDEPFIKDICFFLSDKMSTTKEGTLFMMVYIILQWGCSFRKHLGFFDSKTGLRSSTSPSFIAQKSFSWAHVTVWVKNNPFLWRHNRNFFTVNIHLQVCSVPTLEGLLLELSHPIPAEQLVTSYLENTALFLQLGDRQSL